MNFLGGVNRVLRANGILRGDTDAITTFSNLQHGATVQLAILAIQDELTELVSDKMIPYEHTTTGTISAVAGTRSYALASGFVRFSGVGVIYDSASNLQLFEFPGGEERLKLVDTEYKTGQGQPYAWYFDLTTTKKVALYPVPNSSISYTYDYEADVSVTNSTDTLPFHNEIEAQAFCRMASRRFKFLFEGKNAAELAVDPEHMKAKATLADLMSGKNQPNRYAPTYR